MPEYREFVPENDPRDGTEGNNIQYCRKYSPHLIPLSGTILNNALKSSHTDCPTASLIQGWQKTGHNVISDLSHPVGTNTMCYCGVIPSTLVDDVYLADLDKYPH